MRRVVLSVGATVLGIALVQVANGFLGTLVSMSTVSLGFSPAAAGVVLAAYFGGYTLGAATVGPVLLRVGHIRLFAALAGLVAASIALQPVFTSAPAWIAIRAVTGFGAAGLFITAESWLNAAATPKNRGALFALYMVATSAAFGGGQFLINVPAPGGFELFSMGAAIFCLALVPIALTRSAAPRIAESPRLRMGELRRLAPVSMLGVMTAGVISSAFYSLIPAYAQSRGLDPSAISLYIATAVFGGLVFQVPVGWVSDRFDRRRVAAFVALGLAASTACLAAVPLPVPGVLFATFLLGGFLSTIYPVCVAHANDRVASEMVVSTSGQLVLIHGLSSFVGPFAGSNAMGWGGIEALFGSMAVVAALFAALAFWRSTKVAAPERKERPFLILDEHACQTISHVAEETAVAAPGDAFEVADAEYPRLDDLPDGDVPLDARLAA